MLGCHAKSPIFSHLLPTSFNVMLLACCCGSRGREPHRFSCMWKINGDQRWSVSCLRSQRGGIQRDHDSRVLTSVQCIFHDQDSFASLKLRPPKNNKEKDSVFHTHGTRNVLFLIFPVAANCSACWIRGQNKYCQMTTFSKCKDFHLSWRTF